MASSAAPPVAAPAPVTAGDPQSELNAMEADPGVMAALQDKSHPQYRELVEKRAALFAAIYPEGGTATADGQGTGQPVDHLELLAVFEGGPPLEGMTPEEAMAGARHNRTVIAGALSTLGATAEETQRLVREVSGMRAHKIELSTEEASKFMRDTWGEDYDANLGVARRALASLNNPALEAWLDATGFGNVPVVIRTLHDLGKRKGL